MGLLSKKITIQTKLSPKNTREILANTIDGTRKNNQIGKLVTDHKYVRTHMKDELFHITIGEISLWFGIEPGMRTILKGNMKADKGSPGTIISMVIRPSANYLLRLALIFVFLIAVLIFCFLTKNITPALIASGLLIGFYFTQLIVFNLLVKKYKQLIEDCFTHKKYGLSLLS